MSAAPLHLIVADDHPLFRAALCQTITASLPQAQVMQADSLDSLRALFSHEGQPIDLVLLDLRMPGVQGFSSLIELRAEYPSVPVVIVSAVEEPRVMARAREFGAAGFIPKSSAAETIGQTLRRVLDGETGFPELADDAAPVPAAIEQDLAQRLASLTPQQLRVLRLLGEGRLNKQIAFALEVTEATVKAHMTAILRKLGMARRTQVALLAQRLAGDGAAPLWSDELWSERGDVDTDATEHPD